MGYNKEKAAKFNHQHIIENELVQDFLKKCDKVGYDMPIEQDYQYQSIDILRLKNKVPSDINRIVTADGGYQEIIIDDHFPSYKLCYYSVGILTFNVADLFGLENEQTINPDDLGRLKNLDRFAFVVPMQNLKLKDYDFKYSIRKTIFDIFKDNKLSDKKGDSRDSMLNTIKWLIFKEYSDKQGSMSARCPNTECSQTHCFKRQTDNYYDEKNDFIKCDKCGGIVYITDCFQLHDLVDEINGAGAITSYIMSVFEVVLLLCIFRFCLETQNEKILSEILFIKDGSLALYSKLDDFAFKIIRPFIQFLYDKSLKDNLCYMNFIGLEKSGYFVEHLKNIEKTKGQIYNIKSGTIILPNLAYIKRYITGDNDSVFGLKTYFGIKMFVKKDKDLCFVLDIALPYGLDTKKDSTKQYEEYIKNPNIEDFLNLKNILEILFRLKCDLYETSFIPIAMVNKCISLSNIPSKKILNFFTKGMMG